MVEHAVKALPTCGARALSIVRRDYREDIDWLRAIAVLAVVAFHFEAPAVYGGFVGVDIFFVISGFLITGIIQSEVKATVFLRALLRAPRAPPAARALRDGGADRDPGVPLSVDLGARGILPLGRGRRHLHLQLLLLVQTGYFDHAAVEKPLLHTWSLAVEEQFYLALPLLLFVLLRLSRAAAGSRCRPRWPARRSPPLRSASG